jgi:phytoene synthase
VVSPSSDPVGAAYRECERITRAQARNFSWGIRLLPTPKRSAMSAVYALARRIDDIGDGTLPPDRKVVLLAQARAAALAPGEHPNDPVLIALDDAAHRLPIPLEAFGDLVDGCEMDVRGTTYETMEDLVVYCRRVAGSIGRLSLGIFQPDVADDGYPDAVALADSLGVAFQLTNILRDIREYLGNGRVYLPARDLALFDCTLATLPDGTLDPQGGALAEVIRFEAARAASWYDRGLLLLGLLDRRSAACCSAMAGIYRELLARIANDPSQVMRGRMSLSTRDKLRVAGRSLAGAGVGRG